MTQIEKDIAFLRGKYGDLHAIKIAEAIIRVCDYATSTLKTNEDDLESNKTKKRKGGKHGIQN